MNLIDNVNTRLGDDLKSEIKRGSKISIAASSFSIYAFEALKKELMGIDELRFIFTSPAFIKEEFQKQSLEFYIPHIYNEANLCGGEFELRLKNELNQRAIAQECSQWVLEKVRFKSNKQASVPLNSVINIQQRDAKSKSYTGLSSFTTADLGFTHRKGFPALIHKVDFPQSQSYLEWFDQIWSNDEYLKDVTQGVLDYFKNTVQENSPEFIYFITLYNIFSDFIEDISLGNLPNEETGFKKTVIWDKLYNFQKDAVIGAINKLEKYNGCILADSVGLGKTFSALGVIKYYEKRNKDVLVLCPKKLEANWNMYRYNDKNNFLAADRFRYDVLFHTDLSRDRGMSNGRNLETVNWGNYGLVVIDESHNFRNNNTTEGKENRYQGLMRKILKEGIETKVLMLSATPVNNRFNDLRNQLALAYEGDASKIDEKLATNKGIEQIFKSTQAAFNLWSKLAPATRTTEKLLEMLDFDFFEILDSLTIARSRKHITSYYDTSEIGKFPQRNKPVSIRSKLTEDDRLDFSQVADRLGLLNLSVYTPLNYLKPNRIAYYAALYEKKVQAGSFSQFDREKSLRILMQINLLKRIESSIDSFRLTLEKLKRQTEETITALSKGVPNPYSNILDDSEAEEFDWEANWGDEESYIGNKVKVHIADLDRIKWKEDLAADLSVLKGLLDDVNPLHGEKDLKLKYLKEVIVEKLEQPLNPGNKKVIVFTAFADTANYLYDALKDYFKEDHGLNSALITGTKRLSTAKSVPTDLNTLLTCFSPISKGKAQLHAHLPSIDILIATDCISEGQNLQDCDFLVNYDIHWNPVRIIQRFGRIDRIGSVNENITMVNFWPDVTLDAYINLKQRVENKMLISNMASTGDDNILHEGEQELEYRKIQLQKLQDEVVDLEDLREGVDITDLGLNDFRIDLSNFIKSYGKLKNIPEGIHAVASAGNNMEKGIIYVLKNINEEINIDKINRLHPYYLVYIKEDGNIIYNHVDAKKILDILRRACKGNQEPIENLCQELKEETNDFREMSKYSSLLKTSIGSILKTEEEKEVFSLFKAGGTTSAQNKFKGIEDFKLISFIIIK